MKTYTKQQVFNKVAKHLLTQKIQSIGSHMGDSICLYKNEDGLKCAAGCLIKSKDYRKVMEGKDILGVIELYPNVADYLEEHIAIISDLQFIHDNHAESKWKEGLLKLAADLDLDNSVVLEMK